MTSAILDYGNTKRDCFNLARTSPEVARLTAKNYDLFTLESGTSYSDFNKYSFGRNIRTNQCKDLYKNCFEVVEPFKCCAENKLINGSLMKD